MSLADALEPDAGTWVVTAPSEDRLAAARTELGLPAGRAGAADGVAAAWPTVASVDQHFGGDEDRRGSATARHEPDARRRHRSTASHPGTRRLVVPKVTEVRLFVEADDTIDIVNWLTSCGTMHDFDLPHRVPARRARGSAGGQLAVVLRDAKGGVAWRVWNISRRVSASASLPDGLALRLIAIIVALPRARRRSAPSSLTWPHWPIFVTSVSSDPIAARRSDRTRGSRRRLRRDERR